MEALDTTFNVKQIQVWTGETLKFTITNKIQYPARIRDREP